MNAKLKFFLKSLFMVVSLIVLVAVIMPQYSTGYNAAIIDKYDRLKSIDEPKIILVGDSNVAFGFDCKIIEQAFDRPVVNMGLHGGLLQPFHSEIIKPCIREGDIIIIAPAVFDAPDDSIDALLAWMAVENKISVLEGVFYNNYKEMIAKFPAYLQYASISWLTNSGNKPIKDSVYSRDAFDEYGDIKYSLEECVMAEGDKTAFLNNTVLSQAMEDYWNEYTLYVQDKGAVVLMSYPPILQETLDVDLSILQHQLQTRLKMPLISDFNDYIFPLELFYDTGFHLNDEGRLVRTQKLVSDLKEYLKNNDMLLA